MAGDDKAAQLRSLHVGGKHEALVVALAQSPWPDDCLQLIGDGLVDAVRHGARDSVELARRCINALRERGWDGDEELAQALDAATGDAPAPMLRPLAVDLEELSMVLEGDPIHGGGRIDLGTGEVWPQAAIDYADETGEYDEDGDDDPARWLWVECEGSRGGYQDMVGFIEALEDQGLADQLARAISGRGAFRRFKDRLGDRPELLARWHAFSADRHRGRARRWLAQEGYTPVRS